MHVAPRGFRYGNSFGELCKRRDAVSGSIARLHDLHLCHRRQHGFIAGSSPGWLRTALNLERAGVLDCVQHRDVAFVPRMDLRFRNVSKFEEHSDPVGPEGHAAISHSHPAIKALRS